MSATSTRHGLGAMDTPASDSEYSLDDLSQGTMNQLLHEVGADTLSTNSIIEEFHSHNDPIDDEDTTNNVVDSVTMERVVMVPVSLQSAMSPPSSQPFQPQNQQSLSIMPLPTLTTSVSNATGAGHASHSVIKTTLPSNAPMPGQYSFRIVLNDEKPVSKTATFTYSALVQRAYIKKDVIIGLAFSFSQPPPSSTIIRVMAIHKTPELVGENVMCCLKHVEELKKKGLQNCRHFVRGADQCQTSYHEDPISGRLSITMPVGSLQQNPDNQLQAFYKFPCYTSELRKGVGKLTQLIFTLECSGQVIGRAVVDARVCASPGRDRDIDETRMHPHAASPTSPLSLSPSPGEGPKRGRKRPAAFTQSLEYSLPTKFFCNPASQQKVVHSLEITKDLIPFLDVCAVMMEKVYAVKCQLESGATPSPGLTPSPPVQPQKQTQQVSHTTFSDTKSWLEHLDLGQYTQVFSAHGVHSLSQVVDLTEQELQHFGIKSQQHRLRLLDGRRLIPLVEGGEFREEEEEREGGEEDRHTPEVYDEISASQPFSSQFSLGGRSYSQISSVSSASSGQGLEILRIKMKKTYSSSSSSSSSNGTGYFMDC